MVSYLNHLFFVMHRSRVRMYLGLIVTGVVIGVVFGAFILSVTRKLFLVVQ